MIFCFSELLILKKNVMPFMVLLFRSEVAVQLAFTIAVHFFKGLTTVNKQVIKKTFSYSISLTQMLVEINCNYNCHGQTFGLLQLYCKSLGVYVNNYCNYLLYFSSIFKAFRSLHLLLNLYSIMTKYTV